MRVLEYPYGCLHAYPSRCLHVWVHLHRIAFTNCDVISRKDVRHKDVNWKAARNVCNNVVFLYFLPLVHISVLL